eukprot:TRINITY_DN5854_c1_g3_i1.p1 TRINITY_DN5854_c1_g3~~TRINITY_DN5854_c1_g3_i1.p1  ORF type:complete len:2292 (+),score=432.38 TRINITY_DN5854_c1_g3_i1:418-7293(+)
MEAVAPQVIPSTVLQQTSDIIPRLPSSNVSGKTTHMEPLCKQVGVKFRLSTKGLKPKLGENAEEGCLRALKHSGLSTMEVDRTSMTAVRSGAGTTKKALRPAESAKTEVTTTALQTSNRQANNRKVSGERQVKCPARDATEQTDQAFRSVMSPPNVRLRTDTAVTATVRVSDNAKLNASEARGRIQEERSSLGGERGSIREASSAGVKRQKNHEIGPEMKTSCEGRRERDNEDSREKKRGDLWEKNPKENGEKSGHKDGEKNGRREKEGLGKQKKRRERSWDGLEKTRNISAVMAKSETRVADMSEALPPLHGRRLEANGAGKDVVAREGKKPPWSSIGSATPDADVDCNSKVGKAEGGNARDGCLSEKSTMGIAAGDLQSADHLHASMSRPGAATKGRRGDRCRRVIGLAASGGSRTLWQSSESPEKGVAARPRAESRLQRDEREFEDRQDGQRDASEEDFEALRERERDMEAAEDLMCLLVRAAEETAKRPGDEARRGLSGDGARRDLNGGDLEEMDAERTTGRGRSLADGRQSSSKMSLTDSMSEEDWASRTASGETKRKRGGTCSGKKKEACEEASQGQASAWGVAVSAEREGRNVEASENVKQLSGKEVTGDIGAGGKGGMRGKALGEEGEERWPSPFPKGHGSTLNSSALLGDKTKGLKKAVDRGDRPSVAVPGSGTKKSTASRVKTGGGDGGGKRVDSESGRKGLLKEKESLYSEQLSSAVTREADCKRTALVPGVSLSLNERRAKGGMEVGAKTAGQLSGSGLLTGSRLVAADGSDAEEDDAMGAAMKIVQAMQGDGQVEGARSPETTCSPMAVKAKENRADWRAIGLAVPIGSSGERNLSKGGKEGQAGPEEQSPKDAFSFQSASEEEEEEEEVGEGKEEGERDGEGKAERKNAVKGVVQRQVVEMQGKLGAEANPAVRKCQAQRQPGCSASVFSHPSDPSHTGPSEEIGAPTNVMLPAVHTITSERGSEATAVFPPQSTVSASQPNARRAAKKLPSIRRPVSSLASIPVTTPHLPPAPGLDPTDPSPSSKDDSNEPNRTEAASSLHSIGRLTYAVAPCHERDTASTLQAGGVKVKAVRRRRRAETAGEEGEGDCKTPRKRQKKGTVAGATAETPSGCVLQPSDQAPGSLPISSTVFKKRNKAAPATDIWSAVPGEKADRDGAGGDEQGYRNGKDFLDSQRQQQQLKARMETSGMVLPREAPPLSMDSRNEPHTLIHRQVHEKKHGRMSGSGAAPGDPPCLYAEGTQNGDVGGSPRSAESGANCHTDDGIPERFPKDVSQIGGAFSSEIEVATLARATGLALSGLSTKLHPIGKFSSSGDRPSCSMSAFPVAAPLLDALSVGGTREEWVAKKELICEGTLHSSSRCILDIDLNVEAGAAVEEELNANPVQTPSGVSSFAPSTKMHETSNGTLQSWDEDHRSTPSGFDKGGWKAQEIPSASVPSSNAKVPRRLDLDLNRLDAAVEGLEGEEREAGEILKEAIIKEGISRGEREEAASYGDRLSWENRRGGESTGVTADDSRTIYTSSLPLVSSHLLRNRWESSAVNTGPYAMSAAASGAPSSGGYEVPAGVPPMPPRANETTREAAVPVAIAKGRRKQQSAMADFDLNVPAEGQEAANPGKAYSHDFSDNGVATIPWNEGRFEHREHCPRDSHELISASVLGTSARSGAAPSPHSSPCAIPADQPPNRPSPSRESSCLGAKWAATETAAETQWRASSSDFNRQETSDRASSQLPLGGTWDATAGVARLLSSQSTAAALQALLLSPGLNPNFLSTSAGRASSPLPSSSMQTNGGASYTRAAPSPTSKTPTAAAAAAAPFQNSSNLSPSVISTHGSPSPTPPTQTMHPPPREAHKGPNSAFARAKAKRVLMKAARQGQASEPNPIYMHSETRAERASASAGRGKTAAEDHIGGWIGNRDLNLNPSANSNPKFNSNFSPSPNPNFNSNFPRSAGKGSFGGGDMASALSSNLTAPLSDQIRNASSLGPPLRSHIASARTQEEIPRHFSHSVNPAPFPVPNLGPLPRAASFPSLPSATPAFPFATPHEGLQRATLPNSFPGPSPVSNPSPAPFQSSSLSSHPVSLNAPSFLPSPSPAEIAAFFANTLKAVSGETFANLGPPPPPSRTSGHLSPPPPSPSLPPPSLPFPASTHVSSASGVVAPRQSTNTQAAWGGSLTPSSGPSLTSPGALVPSRPFIPAQPVQSDNCSDATAALAQSLLRPPTHSSGHLSARSPGSERSGMALLVQLQSAEMESLGRALQMQQQGHRQRLLFQLEQQQQQQLQMKTNR